ncbi:hypothetical protein [Palleronia sp.]|uniref:hypothetical protein n=1 Tax=Palleronia sp. TaxID=1940284 RepID=UPI0035C7E9D4
MMIHHFTDAGEYTETTEARPDPRNSTRHLVPGNATTIELPAPIEGTVRVFDGDAWSHVTDRRGVVYWTADGSKHEIKALGEDVPADAYLDPAELPAAVPSVSDVRLEAARRLDLIANPYTAQERETWHRQIEEATRLLADPVTPAPFVASRAAARGMTPAELATEIIAKADAYAAAAGAILAVQDELSALDPIPVDFAADARWP